MTTGLNHGYGGVKVNKKLNVKGFCTDLAYDLVGSALLIRRIWLRAGCPVWPFC